MSEHLPECPSGQRKWQRAEAPMYGALCICRELRACEQRMLDDDVLAAAYHGQAGYAAGVQAAREAVAAIAAGPQSALYRDYALAAIDALRARDHSAARQPEGYSPTATDNRP